MIFITLEGIDGSGKTSVSQIIKENLEKENFNILFTREPGGEPISEKIRNIILDKEHKNMSAWTETLLYISARKQHVDEVIKPALDQNKIVICDRFRDSTSAYQGNARGLGIDSVDKIQNIILGELNPNLTLYLDISPIEANDRVKKRKRDSDRLDNEGIDFQNKVYEGYEILLEKHADRFKIINARQKLEKVAEDAYKIIKTFIEKRI